MDQHAEAKADPEQFPPPSEQTEGHGQRRPQPEGHEDQHLAAFLDPEAAGHDDGGQLRHARQRLDGEGARKVHRSSQQPQDHVHLPAAQHPPEEMEAAADQEVTDPAAVELPQALVQRADVRLPRGQQRLPAAPVPRQAQQEAEEATALHADQDPEDQDAEKQADHGRHGQRDGRSPMVERDQEAQEDEGALGEHERRLGHQDRGETGDEGDAVSLQKPGLERFASQVGSGRDGVDRLAGGANREELRQARRRPGISRRPIEVAPQDPPPPQAVHEVRGEVGDHDQRRQPTQALQRREDRRDPNAVDQARKQEQPEG